MNEALLALLSALVGALIFVVKWLVGRSDKQLEKSQKAVEQRDTHIGSLIEISTAAIEGLQKAIASFNKFEKEEEHIHAEILGRLDKHHELLNGISQAQARTVELLDRMIERLEAKP